MIRRICLTAIPILFLFKSTRADHLEIYYPKPESESYVIRVVPIDKIQYISTLDFAKAYKTRTFYRSETGKLVIFFENNEIKITINNTFLMVGERVYQLPYPAVLIDEDVYVPALPFLSIIKESIIPKIEFKLVEDSTKYIIRDYSTGDVVTSFTNFKKIHKEEAVDLDLMKKMPLSRLTDIKFEEKKNGVLIELLTDGKFKDSDFSYFFKDGNWFYLTIYGAECDSNYLSMDNPISSIEKVEALPTGESVQISLKLKNRFKSADVHYEPRTSKILLSLFLPLDTQIKKKIEEAKTSWIIDTIVLDPGHGGKDPGTTGRWGKMDEKDIVLDIALRLGKLLEEESGLRVVYTRKKDEFVPLWRRTEIANKSGGKLFISLHVNAHKNRDINGVELYLLKPGKSEDAIQVAERENSVIKLEDIEDRRRYEGYDNISNILANMVHSANMKDSEKFAEMVSTNISEMVPLKNRGVKQAGFYVLVGASMPNLLCEVGYITNRKDEKLLNSGKYRQLIAEALYKSIIEFKEVCDQSIVKTGY